MHNVEVRQKTNSIKPVSIFIILYLLSHVNNSFIYIYHTPNSSSQPTFLTHGLDTHTTLKFLNFIIVAHNYAYMRSACASLGSALYSNHPCNICVPTSAPPLRFFEFNQALGTKVHPPPKNPLVCLLVKRFLSKKS